MNIFFKQLLLTCFAFLLAQFVLACILYFIDVPYLNPLNWYRYDSAHYLSIAQEGYTFFPCNGDFNLPTDSNYMCGNAGWFPGYPILLKLMSLTKVNTILISGVVSKLFYFLSLLLITIIAKINNFSLKNILFLLFPTFFFSFIYYNAIFPISAVLFFSLLGFHFHLNNKRWALGCCCFLAALLYPTGFLLSFVFALHILLNKNDSQKKKFLNLLIPLSFGGIGVLLTFLIFHIQVGDWTAYMQVQAKYGHSLQSPIKNVGNMLKRISTDIFSWNNIIILQSIIIITSFFGLSIYFFKKKLHTNKLFLLSYIFVFLFLVFPWAVGGSGMSMYRAESLLIPFVFFLKDIKTFWKISILMLLIPFGIITSYLFFTNVLI